MRVRGEHSTRGRHDRLTRAHPHGFSTAIQPGGLRNRAQKRATEPGNEEGRPTRQGLSARRHSGRHYRRRCTVPTIISTFIRAQWESEEVEDVDDERRQILEEAAELDHIWGVWEEEEGVTSTRCKWIKQPSQRGNGMRHHVEVHASHRKKK